MAFFVQREVVGAREAASAVAALERLNAGMLAVVARQLVRARETPVTGCPGTYKRFLASVRPLVSLEMRALTVHLYAIREIAAMHAARCDMPIIGMTGHCQFVGLHLYRQWACYIFSGDFALRITRWLAFHHGDDSDDGGRW